MKRLLIYTGSFLLIACSFTSCELDTCKVCKQVTYVNEKWDHDNGSPAEYCGASLIAIQAQPDVIDGNVRTTWECK